MEPSTELLQPLELLPHRYPFLLVDRITRVVPGKQAFGIKTVTHGEWCVGGAAETGAGTMPHMLIVESLAQLSAALFSTLMDGTDGAIGYFMGIDNVRCRGDVRPGDVLDLQIDLAQFRRGVCKTHGVARVNGVEVVRADLTTILRAAPAR
ncbi:MAG: 3-hydroxyacyl-ACP dehydratase FabZ [Gemmatimonadetes bacterium]|nr:3-hydroxyacyl-ACP dehydratase FabZ [Gemmatimonadota bacterium]